ncbi:MAG: hypothetical protein AAGC93_31120 [Cyanobacteria bacterium P01_F01_bin.53]
MARKRRSYHLDERVIEAIQKLAGDSYTSANRYLEMLLFDIAKAKGALPPDAEPLGETRGGDRTSEESKDG